MRKKTFCDDSRIKIINLIFYHQLGDIRSFLLFTDKYYSSLFTLFFCSWHRVLYTHAYDNSRLFFFINIPYMKRYANFWYIVSHGSMLWWQKSYLLFFYALQWWWKMYQEVKIYVNFKPIYLQTSKKLFSNFSATKVYHEKAQ